MSGKTKHTKNYLFQYYNTKGFKPQSIDIDSKRMNLYLLINRLKHNEVDLETSFQRKKGLWNNIEQSRFIESILIRFPLPTFYFDGSNEDKLLIVDGLQRMTTLFNFIIKKEASLKLQGLEYLLEYEGKTYAELPRDLQRRIDETEVPVYIINPGTPQLVKYSIYKRINTGGLILNEQEIRHALFQGIPSDFIEELASLTIFKEATDDSIKSERMEDREYITRFLAFKLNSLEEYTPNLEILFNEAMLRLGKTSAEERNMIKEAFKNAMYLAKNIFGQEAFRKIKNNQKRRSPINKALFDTWSINLAKLNKEEAQKILQNKTQIKSLFIEVLQNDKKFMSSISSSTSNLKNVNKRFNTIKNILNKVL